jgi:predicted metal-binding membrane protein
MRATNVAGLKNQESTRPSSRRRAPVIWPWILVFTAWTVALVAFLTKQNNLIDHHYLIEQSHLPLLAAFGLFLVGWQIMTIAMMLPSSMPMVYMMVYASRKQQCSWHTMAAFLAAYALVWTAFACAAFIGDTQLHRLVHAWPWLSLHSWLIGTVTLAVAGAFQFSPLKHSCLKQCRSPFGFFGRYYRPGVKSAWDLGLRHGAFCLGCCWALMLVMFGLGVGSLMSMALLTGAMVIEKTYPGGNRLSPYLGGALLGLAVLWFMHPAWLVGGIGL